jgi:hypothetical protein
MAYTTNRVAPGFTPPGEVRNGASARGQVLENVANNHLYLAVRDTEMRSVYMGEMTDEYIKLKLRLNPFATTVELFFLCFKDQPDKDTTQYGILVECPNTGDIAYMVDLPIGEDLTTTGGSLQNSSFKWVYFVGRATGGAFTGGPRAVDAESAGDDAYVETQVDITIDPNVYVKSIQFRVLPTQHPIDVP